MRTSFGICSRKTPYATGHAAAQVAANATVTLRPYHCDLCRDYHLTSCTKGMSVSRKCDKAAP